MHIFWTFVVIYCIIFGKHLCADCPKDEIIKPCYCTVDRFFRTTKITCEQKNVDIKAIFKTLSAEIKGSDKLYDEFHMRGTGISELVDGMLSDVKFKKITIESEPQLTKFNVNALSLSAQLVVDSLSILDTPVQSQSSPDVFKFINTLTNLGFLSFRNTKLTAIPNNAFYGLSKLTNIALQNGVLTRVETNSFSNLSSLQELDLSSNKITYISDQAFDLGNNNTSNAMRLALNSNGVTDKQLYDLVKGILNIKRAVNLDIDDNNISILNQKVFEPFLKLRKTNTITVSTLSCQDCYNYWLPKDFKSSDIQSIHCINADDLLDKNIK
ncbi:leucine-rich repeats and immunoglobulin-like domains protein 2 [Oppia nitens]|uniref:leucine-rich repeats and immunoglobulin-like domains protein 2 n=1 Tax=Oppia nitens TaxID=1686743 RepID=UPI0023DAC6AB|nr:leucine-rich repeats and immunoglobulin-like domains protein 2 [Oppia nitens]